MTAVAMLPAGAEVTGAPSAMVAPPDRAWRRMLHSGRIVVGGGVLLVVLAACLLSLPWTLNTASSVFYNAQAYPSRAARERFGT